MIVRVAVNLTGLLLSSTACRSGVDVSGASLDRSLAGEEVFMASGCRGCHMEAGGAAAPRPEGLYGEDVRLEGGEIVVADEAYLRESILRPGAKIVEGYPGRMPESRGILTADQVDALIIYVRSLAD
jgi:cytochrome c oxidase subunit 2